MVKVLRTWWFCHSDSVLRVGYNHVVRVTAVSSSSKYPGRPPTSIQFHAHYLACFSLRPSQSTQCHELPSFSSRQLSASTPVQHLLCILIFCFKTQHTEKAWLARFGGHQPGWLRWSDFLSTAALWWSGRTKSLSCRFTQMRWRKCFSPRLGTCFLRFFAFLIRLSLLSPTPILSAESSRWCLYHLSVVVTSGRRPHYWRMLTSRRKGAEGHGERI